MRDSFGRVIDYARISITERCNLKCVYCMPETGEDDSVINSAETLLSYDDIVFLCKVLAASGVSQIRITGGEPLVRPHANELIRGIKEIPDISYVSLTTNGILLSEQAGALADAGLDGINISLDSLDQTRYHEITRGGDVSRVLAGIETAFDAGISKIKLNCVPTRGIGKEDVVGIAEMARNRQFHIRFIEMMPIGCGAFHGTIENDEIRLILEKHFGPLKPWAGKMGNGPAKYYGLPGFKGKIGFISAMSSSFCQQCNRIRITSDGVLKTCLHMDQGISIRLAIKSRNHKELRSQLEQAVQNKPAKHHFSELPASAGADHRHMFQIGG